MGCSCGVGQTCTGQASAHAQSVRRMQQVVVFGSVCILFVLRWFHVVDVFMGVDIAYLAIGIGSARMYSRAIEALLQKRLNTDVLIGIAIIAALFVPEVHSAHPDWLGSTVKRLVSSHFFPAGSVIIIMLTIEMLETVTFIRMKTAVDRLMAMAPKRARIQRGSVEEEIDIACVVSGDILIVKSGETIPVDGILIKGDASVNESTITGESLPIEKSVGSQVMAGTLCELGAFEMQATKVGEDTTIARVIRLIQEAQAQKPNIQKYADKVAKIFIPTILGISAIVFLLTGDSIKMASVLLVACPCALSMATPAAVIAGIGNGARKGILIKGGAYLEAAAKVDCVIFDKTGTLTMGEPSVTHIITFHGMDVEKLLLYAASAEKLSEHPFSASIVAEAHRQHISIVAPDSFKVFASKGVSAHIAGASVVVGNYRMLNECDIEVSSDAQAKIALLEKEASTFLLVSIDGKAQGAIVIADFLRDEALETIQQLRGIGIKKILLLSGDKQDVSDAIGTHLGVDEVYAHMLPEDKVRIVEEQKKAFTVAMVGDGINDAPALAAAHIAIVMGSGTDVSIDSADIVLKTNDLRKVLEVLQLGRQTLRTIKGNIIFSMVYNVLGIALSAIGIFVPTLAVLFQEAGCFSVMLNSALLIRYNSSSFLKKGV